MPSLQSSAMQLTPAPQTFTMPPNHHDDLDLDLIFNAETPVSR